MLDPGFPGVIMRQAIPLIHETLTGTIGRGSHAERPELRVIGFIER